MNVQLVESLIQVILSLQAGEQLAIAGKRLKNLLCPLTQKLVQLAQKGGNLNFLNDEPELYILEYRQAIA
ncbi:hypothetical protein Osc7112_2094 [Oscillatoria nigro-viridis PCC 7112]|uniref:Uncharacterized protein n=1 Tax=Phormidium nigroviride PCC 7112 TaxID=179408 RepID=K9VER3_9CYAN|nr:hypothetical protein [Oscillatoria nigro-viridis]AFZ06563.1 hypothetical protein Osc7112_2094 [Oscillatoria nigro-viridis PCC 7112]